jgi:hypothetical protein
MWDMRRADLNMSQRRAREAIVAVVAAVMNES